MADFDKEAYWARRNAGQRGQEAVYLPKGHSFIHGLAQILHSPSGSGLRAETRAFKTQGQGRRRRFWLREQKNASN